MPKRRTSNRALVSGGAAITAVFFVIALYAGITFWRARRAAAESSVNALPSVRYLMAARSDVRRLNAAMDEALLDAVERVPITETALVEHRRALDEHVDAYRALATYPGEADGVERMYAALRRFDSVQGHMLALLDGGDWPKVHQYENREWSTASDQLDQSIQALVDLNATVLASRLVHLEEISTTSIAVLSVASLLGLVVALFAIRLAMRSIRLYEDSLEARAGEWEIFSARLAHDLMSPLQVVGFALNRASERDDDERGVRLNTRAIDALRRVREITDALLNFARAGGSATPGERASVPELAAALSDELRGYADDNAVELFMEPILPCEVSCSVGMLNVILSNLLRNAIKHMGDRDLRRVTLRASTRGKRVHFEIEDTGPGLDPGSEEQVFRPFIRRAGADVSGIGLGLATVKRTVEAYGGTVGVSSVKDVGSVFWVELPVASRRVAPPADADQRFLI